jgi:hypothetical protein
MFRAIALLLAAFSVAGAGERAVVGVINPRVELFCIVARLAGYQEYNSGQLRAYNAAVDSWFGPCPIIRPSRLRGTSGAMASATTPSRACRCMSTTSNPRGARSVRSSGRRT